MTHDLKTSLEDLADAEYAGAPLSTVDIGKARADGRRRMLTARLAPVGGGVAVVAACALVVNGLGGASPAKPGGSRAQTAAAAGRTFTGTDPLTAMAAFGYLPDGFQVATHSAGPVYGNKVTLKAPPVGGQPVALTLTRTADEMPLQKYETKQEVTVPGSRKAYLVTDPGDPGAPADLSLHWQNASGSWYTLGGDYQIHGAQLETMLIKVAGSITADDSPVAMPLHIEGLPKGVVPAVATLASPIEVGKGGVAAALSYSLGTVSPASGSFTVTAMPSDWPGPTKIPSVTGEVVETEVTLPGITPAPDHHVCKDADGLHICVEDSPAKNGPDPLASVGGAQGLLDRITSLGTNPANWTTHVVN